MDAFNVEAPKTKTMMDILDKIGTTGKVLLVLDEANENLFESVRNIPFVLVVGTANVCVYDLLNADKVVFTKSALKAVEEGLK